MAGAILATDGDPPDASPVVTPDDPRLAGMGKDRMALPTLRLLIEKIKERET